MTSIFHGGERAESWLAVAGTMGATLATFGTVLALRELAGVGAGAVVLGVVPALTLSRVRRSRARQTRAQLLLSVLVTPAIALLAGEIAELTERHRTAGEALFVLAVSGAIWIRRFGPGWTRAGTLATLPFIALIVTPVPPDAGGMSRLTLAGVALVAVGWATLASILEARPTPSEPDYGQAGAGLLRERLAAVGSPHRCARTGRCPGWPGVWWRGSTPAAPGRLVVPTPSRRCSPAGRPCAR
jgi:hypothetical protein